MGGLGPDQVRRKLIDAPALDSATEKYACGFVAVALPKISSEESTEAL